VSRPGLPGLTRRRFGAATLAGLVAPAAARAAKPPAAAKQTSPAKPTSPARPASPAKQPEAPSAPGGTPVRVGSKPDTEGMLLGNIIITVLEHAQVPVENHIGLGPTRIVRAAILSGAIDLYPEYTGNGAFFFHRETDPAWRDQTAGYALVKQLDAQQNRLLWLPAAPADNAWAIALRAEVAAGDRLQTMSDFARWVNGGARVKLAASAEFVESPAALPAFQATYGFKLNSDQILMLVGGNTAATIRAAAENLSGVNAAMAYGTDGALAVLRLSVMQDDKHAQIFFAPAPVVRQAAAQAYPAIAASLAPVFAALDTATLRRLNAQIAVDGDDPSMTATGWLESMGLLG
jgi:osmoprotectant transport system substrate-binding protein